ncbi:Putative uncharacterized protein [Moritella viscosa]|uniref:Uncharacterized protein n=1 Tax=Moritella viscosa TaxID=80854 RepID=A0A1L0AS83_9GAMM|nr:Putative uncharacterized protein [Moritella viscosa]
MGEEKCIRGRYSDENINTSYSDENINISYSDNETTGSKPVVNIFFDDGTGGRKQEGYIVLDRKPDSGMIAIVLRGLVGVHEVEVSSIQVIGIGEA